jgi:hypothetical protein
MKSFRLPLLAFMLCAVALELLLMWHFRPSFESLRHTTIVSGKVYFSSAGDGAPVVDGIFLFCGMDFMPVLERCIGRVPSLVEGGSLTIAYVDLPALLGHAQITTSILRHGAAIYSRTPGEVIGEYIRSSWRSVLIFPGTVLLLLLGEMINEVIKSGRSAGSRER